jgi:glutamyl/glutaminyl-tRNA synthetase
LQWQAELSFSSDRQDFHYRYVRRLYENGELLREKRWSEKIPRDHQ